MARLPRGALVFAGVLAPLAARAQMTLPAPAPMDAASLFRTQCGTCHTLDPAEPTRQGPPLRGVIGRKAGSVPGFDYSPGFAAAGFTWDAKKLDAWLTDPQAVIPGAVMLYHQRDAAKRQAIIAFLETQR